MFSLVATIAVHAVRVDHEFELLALHVKFVDELKRALEMYIVVTGSVSDFQHDRIYRRCFHIGGRISARHEEKAIKTKDEDLPDDSALKKVFETEAFSPSYPQETIIYPMRRLNQLRTGMSYNLKQINATKTQLA